jgi:hypothetical protein
MLKLEKFILIIITPLLYIVSLWTIYATAHLDGYKSLLLNMTKENGFFETLSVIWLFFIFFYGIYTLVKDRDILNRYAIFAIAIFSILAFLAGMEEISWGQQIFHYKTDDYFLQHNLQKEENLHNLIDANLFSSIIYASVYTILVFTPLFYKIFPFFHKFKILKYFDINPHTILIVLFASTFQIYFYNDLGVVADMVAHFIALGLFGVYIYIGGSNIWLKLHYIVVVIATILAISSYKIFSFFNMQYEIRESFVVLASLLIFIELIWKEKNEKGSMDK